MPSPSSDLLLFKYCPMSPLLLLCGSLDPDLLLPSLLFAWPACKGQEILSGTACSLHSLECWGLSMFSSTDPSLADYIRACLLVFVTTLLSAVHSGLVGLNGVMWHKTAFTKVRSRILYQFLKTLKMISFYKCCIWFAVNTTCSCAWALLCFYLILRLYWG